MRTIFSRLLELFRRRQREDRLSDEIQAHLDLLADEHVARGVSAEEARLAARRAFGGVDQVKAVYRDQRGFRLVDDLKQDVRCAVRLIARDRWFTAAAVTALALGLGVSTTMLTLLYSINFRGLPFDQPSALVAIGGEPTRAQGGSIPFAVFDAWQSTARGFAGMAAHVDAPANLGDETHATDQFPGTFISHNGFRVLRERPILGRDFRPDDDLVGAPPVVIIGHGVWTERYGSDPSVVGHSVRVNGQTATVIGVMPEGFRFPIWTQVWRPLSTMPALNTPAAGLRPVQILARLADGVPPDQGRAELAAIASTLSTVPETDRTRRTLVTPLNEAFVGRAAQPVPMMGLAAVFVVLLIACSHAASLLLARSSARSREMSLRAALGASRGRIVRQLLVESVLMALIAGGVGLALAWFGVRAFANEVTSFGLPYWTKFTFDPWLFSFIAVLCLATGVLFGLVPALHVSRTSLTEVLNQGGRSGTTGRRARRLTTGLLVGELALTLILLSSAGVLIQSANVVYRADQTLDVANLWEFRVVLPQPRYASSERRAAFYRLLDERLAAAPGMESAALASAAPFLPAEGRTVLMDNEAPGADNPSGVSSNPVRTARVVAIGDRYFDTLGLRLRQGTPFENLDASSVRAAALVNERFVEVFSPRMNPIGRQVRLVNDRAPDTSGEWLTIAGVVPSIRQQIAAGHIPVVYVPHATQPAGSASILIRGKPDRFADTLRAEVRRIDPDLPLFGLQSLVRASYVSRWIQRITSTMFSLMAVIATVLSALGLYSVTAYAATERTREVGVRMALGAQRWQVSWLFLRGALCQVSIGLSIGIAGALAAGTLLQGFLIEVRANHPVTLAGVCALMVGVSIAASILPAFKASRLDPVAALRQE